MLGVSTGGRISELLSLRVGDVYQNKKPVTDLLYGKSIVKGGEVSRSVPVNADGRRTIDELVNWHRRHYGSIASKRPLFPFATQVRHCTDAPSNRARHTQDGFHCGGLERTHRDPFTAEVVCTAIV